MAAAAAGKAGAGSPGEEPRSARAEGPAALKTRRKPPGGTANGAPGDEERQPQQLQQLAHGEELKMQQEKAQEEEEEEEMVEEEEQGQAEAGSRERKKKKKLLSAKRLSRLAEAAARRGMVYVSRIPPHMKPLKLRQMLSEYGEVSLWHCRWPAAPS